MSYLFKIQLTRETLNDSFSIEPQIIDFEAPISIRLLTSIENVINNLFMDKECFKLSVSVSLSISTFVTKQKIDKIVNAKIEDVFDYYDNNLLDKQIDIGKV